MSEPAKHEGQTMDKFFYAEIARLEQKIDGNDRRYAEINIEREKALRIKEEGDSKALNLQKETQSYKDEKANQLREQINSERGHYVSQAEFKPVIEFMSGQQAQSGITSPVIALLYVIGGGVVTYLITEVLKH